MNASQPSEPDAEFAALSQAVAIGEVSPLEQHRFAELLRAHPEWKAAHEKTLQMCALLDLNTSQPEVADVSEKELADFAAFRQSHPLKKSDKSRILRFWLPMAAAACMLGLALTWYFQPQQPTIAAALAPRGETVFTEPTMVWENHGEQKYDVWILPAQGTVEAGALFTAKGVRSPLPFSALSAADPQQASLLANNDYRLLVCLADQGRHAGVAVPFRISPAPAAAPPTGTEAELLEKARRHLEAGRPSDGLMVLSGLPNSPAVEEMRNRCRKLQAPVPQ